MAKKSTYHPYFTTRLPASLQRRIRLYAVQHDMKVQQLMTEIVREYFQGRRVRRNGKQESA